MEALFSHFKVSNLPGKVLLTEHVPFFQAELCLLCLPTFSGLTEEHSGDHYPFFPSPTAIWHSHTSGTQGPRDVQFIALPSSVMGTL